MRFGSTRRPAPKSNLQRQREFRARNPHYYRDLHRKRKAQIKARAAVKAAYPELSPDQVAAVVQASSAVPVQPAAAEQLITLALPAASSEPLITVQLPRFAEQQAMQARPNPTPAQMVEQRKRAA